MPADERPQWVSSRHSTSGQATGGLRLTAYGQERTLQRLGFLLFLALFGVPLIQLANDCLDRTRYGLEAPLSAALNCICVIRRDYVSVPIGTFGIRRRLRSLD